MHLQVVFFLWLTKQGNTQAPHLTTMQTWLATNVTAATAMATLYPHAKHLKIKKI